MRFAIPTFAIFVTVATAAYVLEDDYSPSSFASMFDFFTDNDPTNGYVNYISYDQAQSSGLYKLSNGAVYMGVDSTNVASGRGRDSVRISSKKSYNHGLVILDLAHMPAGACGTWPAFWMLGPDWPNNGEIDIIEGVNSQVGNNMAAHTDAGCTITNTGAFSGSLETANCDVNAAGQAQNEGCSIRSGSSNSYGSGFNSNGGGVYATEWTSEAISIWFFPRGGIPSDITGGNPNPSNWGLPQGQFTGGCDIDSKFKNQQLIFDVTFCGDWAGNVWSTDATCSPQGSTCQSFVQNNPSAFQDTYWLINSLRVYTSNGGAAPTQTATGTVTTASGGATVTTNLPGTGEATYTTTTATTFLTVPSAGETSVPAAPTETTPITTVPTPQPTVAPTGTYSPPTPSSYPGGGNGGGAGGGSPPSGNGWNGWSGTGGGPGGGGGGGGGRGGGGGGGGGWGGRGSMIRRWFWW